MSDARYWFLITVAALVAGVFNLPVAFENLRETCKGLLFFEPLKSPGFWIWIIAQLLFPAAIFLVWITDFFSTRPAADLLLLLKATGAGFGFTAFLNARTETGFLTLDIKSIYGYFIRLGFGLIAAQETRRTKRFFREFEEELSRPSADLIGGLKDLRAYFSVDITLTQLEEDKYVGLINEALTQLPQDKQIEVVESLLPDVRHPDLLDTLQQFKCSDEFLRKYFPRQFNRAIARQRQSLA